MNFNDREQLDNKQVTDLTEIPLILEQEVILLL